MPLDPVEVKNAGVRRVRLCPGPTDAGELSLGSLALFTAHPNQKEIPS